MFPHRPSLKALARDNRSSQLFFAITATLRAAAYCLLYRSINIKFNILLIHIQCPPFPFQDPWKQNTALHTTTKLRAWYRVFALEFACLTLTGVFIHICKVKFLTFQKWVLLSKYFVGVSQV